jgi:flagellar biosynthesis protein FlhG
MLNPYQDQASGLRRVMTQAKPFVFTVFSVLKEAQSALMMRHLASSLSRQGLEVLLIDARPSQKKATSYFDSTEDPSLMDFSNGKIPQFKRSIHSVPGISISKLLPINKSLEDYSSADMNALNRNFMDVINAEEIVIIDAFKAVRNNLPIDAIDHSDIVIQMSWQAESITQAYRLIKTLNVNLNRRSFGILIFDADELKSKLAFQNIAKAALDYLQVDLNLIVLFPEGSLQNRVAIQTKFNGEIRSSENMSPGLNKFFSKLGALNALHPSSTLSI